ncbi:MAG: C4-type zinc ribbon domain-containing protein [Candidatus Auribacterota bacterium]|jgi:predicted  nucleic acid-binding Zn-ribbon protein|nr:C4-type zinc ribbon domain-containing protein [Candidatus Auribacterota bacterium]
MIKDILRLLEIQDIDLKIIQLKELQVSLPQTLESLFKDIEAKKKNLADAQKNLQDTRVHQKNIEVDVDANKQTTIKYKNQLCQIKSNEQYRALVKEIETLEKKNTKLEDTILDYMMKAEEKQSSVKQAEENLKRSEQTLSNEEQKIKDRIVAVDNEIKELLAKRNILKENVSPKVMNVYDRTIQHKQPAVVPIHGNICQGCYMKLTPNDVNEVHKGHTLICCDNCVRILYYIPDHG